MQKKNARFMDEFGLSVVVMFCMCVIMIADLIEKSCK